MHGDLLVQNIAISDFFLSFSVFCFFCFLFLFFCFFVFLFFCFFYSFFYTFRVFATVVKITKADRPVNFTIFYGRISTNQPAWPVCTTSESWHTHVGIFASRRELDVSQHWSRERCLMNSVSIGFTQVIIMIAKIGCRVKWRLQRDLGY